jgi:aspartate-semialdehyde dehydrogenase
LPRWRPAGGRRGAGNTVRRPDRGNVILDRPRGEDGWNEEERNVREETRKILSLPDLPVAATCVRVPVRVGHSIAATVQLEQPLAVADALAALRAWPGVVAHDGSSDPLPREVAGTDLVHVGHVRADPDDVRVLHLWIVADNLRKGAATNAVQIAELLLRVEPRSRV